MSVREQFKSGFEHIEETLADKIRTTAEQLTEGEITSVDLITRLNQQNMEMLSLEGASLFLSHTMVKLALLSNNGVKLPTFDFDKDYDAMVEAGLA
jgi:hypothetical protein